MLNDFNVGGMKMKNANICILLMMLFATIYSACELGDTIELPVYTIKYRSIFGDVEEQRLVYGKSENLGRPWHYEGYTFLGWALTKDGPIVYEEGQSVKNLSKKNGEIIWLYGKYSYPYTVKYHSDYGQGNMDDSTFIAGEYQSLPLNTFTRSGYTFAGWATSGTGEVVYADGENVIDLTPYIGTITLYAVWQETIYHITYNANGGSGSMEDTTFTNEERIKYYQYLRQNSFTRSDFIFRGWSDTPDGNVLYTDRQEISTKLTESEITLYAVWQRSAYTVTYNANGGSGTMADSYFTSGTAHYLRLNTFSNGGYVFIGWSNTATGEVVYTDGQNINGLNFSSDPILTLYAVWAAPIIVPGSSLDTKISWLNYYADSGMSYLIEQSIDETISPAILSCNGNKNISITLKGIGGMRTISLSSNGSLFTVNDGITLIMENNITLQGRNGNNASLIAVRSKGSFILNGGVISGNIRSGSYQQGGGISVDGGTFTMNNGTISDNRVGSSTYSNGGQVYVWNKGTFVMNGGSITGDSNFITALNGGCVYVEGTFTMNGGTISGNSSYNSGGGVYIAGTFTMSGGTITGNSAGSYGGGVYLTSQSIINKTGGTITGYSSDPVNGNEANGSSYGHAVYTNGRRKETTAGLGDNLIYNYNNGSPFWSGAWDN